MGAAADTGTPNALEGLFEFTRWDTSLKRDTLADIAFGLPAILIMTLMSLTYCIPNSIGFGFIAHTLIRIVRGKGREANWMLGLISAGFVLYFLIPLLQAEGWV